MDVPWAVEVTNVPRHWPGSWPIADTDRMAGAEAGLSEVVTFGVWLVGEASCAEGCSVVFTPAPRAKLP